MGSSKPTYIFGHRNPDADAVCSAIGYAAFKKAYGAPGHFEAARCGNSNARIDAILSTFGVKLPVFIGDVTPRIGDVMIPTKKVLKVTRQTTCAEALEMIDQHDVRALPVVDDETKALGHVSVFKLGEYFVPKPNETRRMRRVETSVANIVRALHAEVINAVDSERIEELFVRIGAMDIRSFGRFTAEERVPADKSIIVVGDRWDIQEKSLQIGVRLLIITGRLDVDEDIAERAREKGINLIVSPYDSATTSWVVRSATQVAGLMEENINCFNADEPLDAVRQKLGNVYAPINFVTNENGVLEGIFTKSDLLKPIKTEIILVDHNELSQAVPGADKVAISEVIDHHRLGNISTDQPIYFINEPVGSTCTIVADLFKRHGLEPAPEIAGVLISGIIADTLNGRGPTTTDRDREVIEWLNQFSPEPRDRLADIIFSSGSVVLSMTPMGVITSDCKAYSEAEISFSVSQVEELGFNNFWKRDEELIEALESYRTEEGLYFSALLVTDINHQNSLLVVAGPRELMDQITYPNVQRDNIFQLDGIVSRKKQVIPYLSTLLKQAVAV